MTDYLILVTPEIGCAYKWGDYGLEYCPLSANGALAADEDWYPVEEFLVGSEPVTFRGLDVTLSQVYRYAEKILKPKESK